MEKAKIKFMLPFQGWCVSARGLHEHFKILDLRDAIRFRNAYNKLGTRCFCPNCDNELCGSNSFMYDNLFVRYKCTKCGDISDWDFDNSPVPICITRTLGQLIRGEEYEKNN